MSIKRKISKLPNKPGIYFFKNSSGKIIYIGKSINLKNRVRSYFQTKNLGPWTQKMVGEIADISWQETNSEFEALLLEAKLINQHQPEYNIRNKDDKSFLMICISKEVYPRVFTARRKESEGWNFGPFPSASDVRQVLKTIRRILPFRSCKRLPKKPCLYYHLKLCPDCCFGVDRTAYQKTVKKICKFLNGNIKGLIRQLTKEMKQVSLNKEFEKAAQIKNQIKAINFVVLNWQSLNQESLGLSLAKDEQEKVLIEAKKILPQIRRLNRIEAYDISNLYGKQATGSMVVFENFVPSKTQYRRFKIIFKFEPDDVGMMEEVISRRLKHREWTYPQLMVVDGGKGQVGAAFNALKNKNLEKKIFVLGLAKKSSSGKVLVGNDEKIIKPTLKNGYITKWQEIKLQKDNRFLKLLQQLRDESHRFAKQYHLYLRKKAFSKDKQG